jgi:deazaflavin-dependent oxidoreductase (nitroreductase family)
MSGLTDQVMFRFLRLHNAVYQGTNGLIGHRVPGMPANLILHSTGAKSGKPRTHTLSYFRDGADYIIVASRGGDVRSPDWYHNLKAHPDVDVQVGTKRLHVTAKPILPDDPDYSRLWELCNKGNAHRYDAYQKKTSRPIPIVVLTPVGTP